MAKKEVYSITVVGDKERLEDKLDVLFNLHKSYVHIVQIIKHCPCYVEKDIGDREIMMDRFCWRILYKLDSEKDTEHVEDE